MSQICFGGCSPFTQRELHCQWLSIESEVLVWIILCSFVLFLPSLGPWSYSSLAATIADSSWPPPSTTKNNGLGYSFQMQNILHWIEQVCLYDAAYEGNILWDWCSARVYFTCRFLHPAFTASPSLIASGEQIPRVAFTSYVSEGKWQGKHAPKDAEIHAKWYTAYYSLDSDMLFIRGDHTR